MGWTHCGVKIPNGNRAPGGNQNICKSTNLARTCNFFAGVVRAISEELSGIGCPIGTCRRSAKKHEGLETNKGLAK